MDGKATKLVKYLDGSDKRFVIPVYQRNYSWKVENCRQLYDDLVKLILNGRDMHFFGSLVSVNNGKFEEYLIIDLFCRGAYGRIYAGELPLAGWIRA